MEVRDYALDVTDSQPVLGDSDDDGSTGDELDEKDLSAKQLRALHKLNTVSTIDELRIKPRIDARMFIPLCRMKCMPIVRPTLSPDLSFLENDFVHGYREGAAVFYVSTTNEQGMVEPVTSTDTQSWSPMWRAANEQFEAFLESKPSLHHLRNMKFFVCDGNHRLQAWSNVITRDHPTDSNWHVSVDTIVFDTKRRIGYTLAIQYGPNQRASNLPGKSILVAS